MNIKQLLLIVFTLTCVYDLSAMKEKDISSHINVVTMYKKGDLTEGKTIPYLGQPHTVIQVQTEGQYLKYELRRSDKFGPFTLGTIHVTGEDSLDNPNYSYRPACKYTHNKIGCTLLGTSLLTGALVLSYGMVKLRNLFW